MGFKIPKNTVVIDFDKSSKYFGAEVVMSLDFSMEKSFEMNRIAETRDPEKLIDMLLEWILNWNLEDEEGNPLPVSPDSFRKHIPLPFVVEIFNGLRRGMEGLMSVDVPLGMPSKDGDT